MSSKNISYLGNVKLPYEKIFRMLKSISTKSDLIYDTEDNGHFVSRNKEQLRYSKKINLLYHPNKKISRFYKYSNPKFIDIIPKTFWNKFKMRKDTCRISIMKHPPGTVSIPHIDVYYNSIKTIGDKGLDVSKVRRLWIPLSDPNLGHALFVGNEVVYNVKKGTVITINNSVPHSGCNIGDEDRYVLTITGYYGK